MFSVQIQSRATDISASEHASADTGAIPLFPDWKGADIVRVGVGGIKIEMGCGVSMTLRRA
jgi:hypothetical protein